MALTEAFQSTLPVWGATFVMTILRHKVGFQSTLPVWGATQGRTLAGVLLDISIHAPRVGSDCSTRSNARLLC